MLIERFRDIIFCMLLLFLAACTKENIIPGNNSGVKALFSGSVSYVPTKTPIENGEEIPIGSKVGIFALSYSGTNESSVVWPAEQGNYQIFNLEGTTATGTPQTISTATEYIYPLGQKIAFYSYYPGTETPIFNSGSAPSLEVNIPSAPTSQTDFLWATPVTGTSSFPGIDFVYNHALSLIRIKVQKSTSDVLAIKSVRISTAQKQKGIMNIATGTMISTNLSGGTTEFALSGLNQEIPLQGSGEAPLQLNDGKFLFIPGTTITAIKLIIRISGEFIDREYTIANPSLTLVKGEALNILLTVSKKEVVISNWDEIEGDIDVIGNASTANCYMITPNSSIKIPVGIKGNGTASSIEAGISINHTVASMGVLWSTSEDLVTLSDFNSTDQKITITASNNMGNALIAAYSGTGQTGTILWSWHIWVTNYKPDMLSNGTIYSFTNISDVTNIFMDRNLGAISLEYTGVSDQNALYYQYGRKDPFPGSEFVPETIEGPQNMNYSIAYPAKFITGSSGNWCSTNSNYWWMGILGNESTPGFKTIYDPCPSGWRVPVWNKESSPWLGLAITNGNWENSGFSWTDIPHNVGFWPAYGYRNSNSVLSDVGIQGYYWTGSTNSVTEGSLMSFSNSNVLTGVNSFRNHGLQIRCVKE